MLYPEKQSFRISEQIKSFPDKMDANRSTLRHIIIKIPKLKDKKKILKAAREKKLVTYRGVSMRLSVDFSKETL